MKFENQEFCWALIISYVEVVVESWEHFDQFDMYVV
jgi:hypothetical protein